MLPEAHDRERDDDRYLTLAQLVTYSSLSRRSLLLYIADPDHPLPVYRFGRRIAIRKSEFDDWAKRYRERTAPSDEAKARVDARLAR